MNERNNRPEDRRRPAPARRKDSAASSPAAPLDDMGLLALYRPDLSGVLAAQTYPPYRLRQVLEHVMRPESSPFSEATALPGDMRAHLDGLGATTLRLVSRREARDGTVKLLLACDDGTCVESVIMPHNGRTTACISSQAGCPVGCAFCATGAMGFTRNLSTAEIVDQARAAAAVASEKSGRVSNIVYMGMGEPLLNLQAVLASIRVITHPHGLGLGHRSISVSTVGIPAGILRLAQIEPQVNLALSLHASTDRTRQLLIPPRHLHPLSEIMDAAWEHFALTRRKLLIEYLLLKGVNDSKEDARRLAGLLRGHVVTVNLLSWNAVAEHEHARSFSPSPRASVAEFRDALLAAHIEVTLRQSRGTDIDAACGQLAGGHLLPG